MKEPLKDAAIDVSVQSNGKLPRQGVNRNGSISRLSDA